jgi:hypothetical protein
MKRNTRWAVWVAVLLLACSTLVPAQQNPNAESSSTTSATSQLPHLVKFSGTLTGVDGGLLNGKVGVTFALYSEQSGGAPLWLETQNVQPDKYGHYTVLLGSSKPEGLPMDLFVSEQAHWVGVQAQGQAEQPRVLLVSVPYALKAGDAETLGGKPASAFMAASGNAASGNSSSANTITGIGKKDFVPLWLSTTKLGSSTLFQSTAGDLGIGTTTPAANLDVNGTSDIRNTLTLYPNGSAPTLSVNGTAFNVSNTGRISFVSGQSFPGTGTVTSVGSGAGLTGGPISHSGSLSIATGGVSNSMLANPSVTVKAGTDLTGGGLVALGASTTLNLDTTKVPQLSSNNTFTGNQTINGNVSDTGSVSATGTISGQTGSFAGSNTTQILSVIQSGSGNGISATGGSRGYGIFGQGTVGVAGTTSAGSGTGVAGLSTSTIGSGTGVNGVSIGSVGIGLLGQAPGGTLSNTGGSFEGAAAFGSWGDTAASFGNGIGVLATADDAYGLMAANNSAYGEAAVAENLAKSGPAPGLEAVSYSVVGVGAYGEAYTLSGVLPPPEPIGLWGDTGGSLSADCPAAESGSPCGIGVLGTVVNGNAVAGFSSDGYGDPEDATAYFQNNAPQLYSTVLATFGGSAGGSCTIDVAGDLYCTGSKSAVVKVDNGSRKVALYAVEAPENWFEDFGSGRLSNGTAVVALEPTFIQTVNTAMDYHVFLTPNGDSRGLYVVAKTATFFEVREQGGGTSDITFDYRIVARRKGFESIRLNDMTERFKAPQHKAHASRPAHAMPKLPHAVLTLRDVGTHPSR